MTEEDIKQKFRFKKIKSYLINLSYLINRPTWIVG